MQDNYIENLINELGLQDKTTEEILDIINKKENNVKDKFENVKKTIISVDKNSLEKNDIIIFTDLIKQLTEEQNKFESLKEELINIKNYNEKHEKTIPDFDAER